MSIDMLLGVLRMPLELINNDDLLGTMQRQSRYLEAANKIEAMQNLLLSVKSDGSNISLSNVNGNDWFAERDSII